MDAHKISFHKLIHSDSLARSSAIVFAGTMGANVLAYLYHLVMGRLLGPGGYGELSSLLSLLYIFTVPLLVAQMVIVKFVSGFKAHGEVGQSKSLFIKSTKLFVFSGIIGLPVAFIAAPWVTSFLHLSNPLLVILLYLLLLFSLLTMGATGILTGYQKFVWVSIMGIAAILVKLVLSIPFVAWGVLGVVIASVLSAILLYGLYFIPLRFLFSVRRKPTTLTWRAALGFTGPTLLTQLGITSLYSFDIILVRHFFDAKAAGLYAALAILGKIIFYASSAVPTVLFPLASERTAKGVRTGKLVLTAAAIVALISGVITAAYFLAPRFIIGLLFGNAYTGGEELLGRFAVFLTLFSVGNLVALASLAVGKTKIWVIPVLAAVIQIIGISAFHATIAQVIQIDIGVTAFFALGSLAFYLYEKI